MIVKNLPTNKNEYDKEYIRRKSINHDFKLKVIYQNLI